MGRPTIFTQELADTICERIAEGETIRSITSADDMPVWATIWRWASTNDSFRAQYARAREDAADYHADRALQEALSVSESADVPAARLKWDALRWHASKCGPRRWGDRVAQEISGPGGSPIQTSVTVEFVRPAPVS